MALPVPTEDPESAPFWAACAEHRLTAQRCEACSRFRWPPAAFCPHCHVEGGIWTTLSGRGSVQSFVIVERAFDPAFADRIPYIIANVALDDAPGVVIIANLTTPEPEIGLAVAVGFEPRGTVALPVFTPLDTPERTSP